MIFDVDKSLAQLDQILPWDFQVRIKGQTYVTRRPTVSEVGQLSRLQHLSDRDGQALLISLFAEDRPPNDDLDVERTSVFLQAYMAYLSQRLQKNSRAVADQVRAATATT